MSVPMRKSQSWMEPECSDAKNHGRDGWNVKPLTRELSVSNLRTSGSQCNAQRQRTSPGGRG